MLNQEIAPFTFEGVEVRTVSIEGDPWFVAKDVCDILGLGNVTNALRDFPENERNTLTTNKGIHEGPGNPNVNIINEPGLYRLIFQSRKPEAEAFKTWVFTEVLPAIRKHGYYRLKAGYEKQLALQSLPPLENPQTGEYRYKFFTLPHAGEILDWLSAKAAEGFLTRPELMAIITSSTERLAWKEVKSQIVNVFIKENIILTNDVRDYMVIEEAYKRLCESFYEISRHAFTRAVRKHFKFSILEWVKRINGKPTRVFVSCKLREYPPVAAASV
jgi:prophage antirepressor-like protein